MHVRFVETNGMFNFPRSAYQSITGQVALLRSEDSGRMGLAEETGHSLMIELTFRCLLLG